MGGRGGAGISGPSIRSPEGDVRQVITDVGTLGRWQLLADVRERLSTLGYTRQQQDTLLTDLANRRVIQLLPEENQNALTDRKRQAALRYGNDPQHLVRIPTAERP